MINANLVLKELIQTMLFIVHRQRKINKNKLRVSRLFFRTGVDMTKRF